MGSIGRHAARPRKASVTSYPTALADADQRSPFAVVVRALGLVAYEPTLRAMQDFTASRSAATADELWLVQHPPVFTLGQAGKPEHLLRDIGVPVVAIDRGGQVTYHGPGQVVIYVLVDLARRRLKVRELVNLLEQAVIDLLAGYGIAAARRDKAPGVYVGEAKIASLGLRIRHGASYHGLSLNVAMDLSPFGAINVCGYPGLAVTQLADLGVGDSPDAVADALAQHIAGLLPAPH